MKSGLVFLIGGMVFLSGCITVLDEGARFLPGAVSSEYFKTTTAGFRVDTSTEEIEAAYVIAVDVNKPLPAGSFLECFFENPLDKNMSLVSTRDIAGDEKDIFMESPPIDGLQYQTEYAIVLQLYDSPQKGVRLGTHRQVVRSSFQQKSFRRVEEPIAPALP